MTNRVQIPAYTDRWMMGDRYGEVVKISKQRKAHASIVRERHREAGAEIAHVKLDKSGKVMKFLLNDCEYILLR